MGRGASGYIGAMFDVGPQGRVKTGDYTLVVGVLIVCDSEIEIGDDTLRSWNVVLMDSYRMSLDPEMRKRELERAAMSGQRLPMFVDGDEPPAKPIRIGKNAWIGFDSIVLPGVTIGDGAVIGARSVVVEDVEQYSVVAGNPARFIRRLEVTGEHA